MSKENLPGWVLMLSIGIVSIFLSRLIIIEGKNPVEPVVFAIILQSTRGLFSIGLGVLLARWGLIHLEPAVGGRIVWKRLLAAILMVGAIALYALG